MDNLNSNKPRGYEGPGDSCVAGYAALEEFTPRKMEVEPGLFESLLGGLLTDRIWSFTLFRRISDS